MEGFAKHIDRAYVVDPEEVEKDRYSETSKEAKEKIRQNAEEFRKNNLVKDDETASAILSHKAEEKEDKTE